MRILMHVLIIAILAAAVPVVALAQGSDEIDALNRKVADLYQDGKYAEAVPLAEQALALAERVLGTEHADTLISLGNLGMVYLGQRRLDEAEPLLKRALETHERVLGQEHPETLARVDNLADLFHQQGRYADAEPLYRRALDGRERVLGKEHPDTLTSINNLGVLYYSQGRHDDAEPLYTRALEAMRRVFGKEHAETLKVMGNLALLYSDQGRYEESEPLSKETLAITERVLGPEHRETLTGLNNLGLLYIAQGRYGAAEPLLTRALQTQERVLGLDHPDTLTSVNNLAVVYQFQGRYAEAETLFRRGLEGSERVFGKEHPDTIISVQTLGMLYVAQNRFAEAERLLLRAQDAAERVLGPEHLTTLTIANNLAVVYRAQGRHGDAEPLYAKALQIVERTMGSEHPFAVTFRHNLAETYTSQGRLVEAEPLLKRVVEERERAIGKEHPDTLAGISNLARLHQAQGRYDEAEQLYRRALEAGERVLGEQHPFVDTTLSALALMKLEQADWAGAAQFWRRSTRMVIDRAQRVAQNAGQGLTGRQESETERAFWEFASLVKALDRLRPGGGVADGALTEEMFVVAQWSIVSKVGQSLAQMAARGASGDAQLSALVRERQDQVAEWQKRDALRTAALTQALDKRNAKAEAANRDRLGAIDTRIAEIDKRLAAEFPDYAALASPQPLSITEVQAELGDDEALVQFLDTPQWKATPEETFIWVVTKTQVRQVRSDMGSEALNRTVGALRCGLDREAWASSTSAAYCGEVLNAADALDRRQQLPFDLSRAHRLYRALFGEVEDLIKDKHLLIVPAGALTQLPFQVLVTAPSTGNDYRSARWLARDHALTILPAVTSLKALRRVGHVSAASRPLIGFGNPLLDGAGKEEAVDAKLARERQMCQAAAAQQVAVQRSVRAAVPVQTFGGRANPSHIRMQAPLPETADELCTVAQSIRADISDVRLGARATEREVKLLSESGQLAQYRIVHFATHGAMAGELDGTREPGLILTPPQEPSAEDDGYLSGSEIAGLKLDADWVILSACNTAAGDAANADALSGLARAFMYAQARALLVSHWAVDSRATVKLITAALNEVGRDSGVGRAEAVRRAMLKLIDNGTVQETHPAYWAPFIVVGEGGR